LANYEIAVKDTGVGIDSQNFEHLFKEFSRLQPQELQNKLSPHGVGLGLAISNTLAQKLNA
jgi:signal transduction histidine kinase